MTGRLAERCSPSPFDRDGSHGNGSSGSGRVSLRKVLTQYWSVLAGVRNYAAATVVLQFVSGLLEGLALFSLSPILKAGSRQADPQSIVVGILEGVVLVGALSSSARLAADSLLLRLRCVVDERLKSQMTAVSENFWPAFVSLKQGDISKATLVEAFHVSMGASQFLSACGASLIALALAGVAMLISTPMTVLTLLFGAVAGIGYRSVGRRSAQKSAELSRVSAEIGDHVAETFGNLKFFAATGASDRAQSRAIESFRYYSIRFFAWQFYVLAMRWAFEIGGVLLIGSFLGISMLIANQPVTDSLVLLAVFYRLAPRTEAAHEGFFQARNYLPWYDSWEERYRYVVENAEIAFGRATSMFDQELQIENVEYIYPGSTEPAIAGVSLRIQGSLPGCRRRIWKRKSTLMDIVTGLLRPTSGRVLVDGQSLNSRHRPMAASHRAGFAGYASVQHDGAGEHYMG